MRRARPRQPCLAQQQPRLNGLPPVPPRRRSEGEAATNDTGGQKALIWCGQGVTAAVASPTVAPVGNVAALSMKPQTLARRPVTGASGPGRSVCGAAGCCGSGSGTTSRSRAGRSPDGRNRIRSRRTAPGTSSTITRRVNGWPTCGRSWLPRQTPDQAPRPNSCRR